MFLLNRIYKSNRVRDLNDFFLLCSTCVFAISVFDPPLWNFLLKILNVLEAVENLLNSKHKQDPNRFINLEEILNVKAETVQIKSV